MAFSILHDAVRVILWAMTIVASCMSKLMSNYFPVISFLVFESEIRNHTGVSPMYAKP